MLLFMDDQRTLEKFGEIKRSQSLKARSKEVLTNWKRECFRALPWWLVHFSTLRLPVTANFCVRFSLSLVCSLVINADQRYASQPVLSFTFFQSSDYCLKVKFCYFQTVFKLSFHVSVWSKEVKRNKKTIGILLNQHTNCRYVMFSLQNT